MISLTDNAIEKITDVLLDEGPTTRLRLFVQGGGCAGFSYGFTLDSESSEDDMEIPAGNSTLLVDSMSFQYLDGATIDYEEDLMGASFKIKNPQAQSTCGCGASFSI